MKKRIGLMIVIICHLIALYGQDRTPNVWCIGDHIQLDLNSGQPVVSIGSSLGWYSIEGCTSAADSASGQLLFFSNGVWVFDHNYQKMPSDTVLLGGNTSSTQSAITFKKPGSNYLWYLFTVDWQGGSVSYSMIDMSLRGGLGDLVQLPQQLLAHGDEKITAVKMSNGSGYWLAIHGFSSNTYYVYPVTQNGIGAPIISSAGISSAPRIYGSIATKGYMKFSPDRTKIGIAVGASVNMIEVLNFNDTTGVISGLVFIDSLLPNYGYYKSSPYGVSFSPNSKLFYITMIIDSQFVDRTRLYQYDLSSGVADTVLTSRYFVGRIGQFSGGIQLATNNKMYATCQGTYLPCVTYPNVYGPGCGLSINAVSLYSHYAGSGLPNVPEDLFMNNSLGPLGLSLIDTGYQCGDVCTGKITAFAQRGEPPYHFQWSNGDTATSIHNLCAGRYYLTLSDASGISLIDSAVIYGSSPDSIYTSSKVFCNNDSTRICALPYLSSYLWSTGDTGRCIYTHLPGLYNVLITDAHGCSNRLYTSVSEYPQSNVALGVGHDTISVINGASNYQWYYNGQLIPGDTSSLLIAENSGDYSVSVKDTFGCIYHSGISFIMTGLPLISISSNCYIYPNPLFSGNLKIAVTDNMTNSTFLLSDLDGKVLFRHKIEKELEEISIDINAGVYIANIAKANTKLYYKLVKLE